MRFKVFGIGEVLWDVFPTGKKLGGAPGNFAYHARSLGADARLVSRVGDDALGHEILQDFATLGLPTDLVSIDTQHSTGTVSVEVSPDGQPRFTINEDVAWDYLPTNEQSLSALQDADAVCFGSLAQRSPTSRAAIRTLVAFTPATTLRVFDVNLRQHFYSRDLIEESLAISNALKLNDTELPVLAELLQIGAGSPQEQLVEITRRFGLRLIAYTRGANGSLLFDGDRWSEHAGLPAEVKDTVGAGDSFTAAVVIGTLASWNLDTISERANQLAAFVCSADGATPPLPNHLRHLVCSGA